MAGAGTESGVEMWIERVGNYQQERIRGEKQKTLMKRNSIRYMGRIQTEGRSLIV